MVSDPHDEARRLLMVVIGLSVLLFVVIATPYRALLMQPPAAAQSGSGYPRLIEADAPPETVSHPGDEERSASGQPGGPRTVAAPAALRAGDPLPTPADREQSWQQVLEPTTGLRMEIPERWAQLDIAARSSAQGAADMDVVFEDPLTGARFALSVWEAADLDPFHDWLDEVAQGMQAVDGVRPTNAVVAGRDALVAWVPDTPASPAQYAAFLENDGRYYRVVYSALDGGSALSEYVRALVTLTWDGQDTVDLIPALPSPDGTYKPSRPAGAP